MTNVLDLPQQWKRMLMKNPRGDTLENLANALIAMRGAPGLAGLFAFDELARAVMLMASLPDSDSLAFEPRPLEDRDVLAVQEWLQRQAFPQIGRGVIADAIDLVARENAFDPIRNYLDGLIWDGHSRLDTWLHQYLGAAKSAYTAGIGRMFLTAMVARGLEPGCQADHVVVLEGAQGTRKSTACRILGGQWFSDSLPDLSSGKAVSQHLRGLWLIEIAELSAVSKAEAETLKAFVSRRTERYRAPYGRNEVFEPRRAICVGTTNQSTYLKDETGGRRFWPIKTGTIDVEALARDRDQLFAEAVVVYRQSGCWWPDGDFESLHAKPQQEARAEQDAWFACVQQFLSLEYGYVELAQIARGALHFTDKDIGTADQRRIMRLLTACGWTRVSNDPTTNRARWCRCEQ
jgi:predicted P-loop ATPase